MEEPDPMKLEDILKVLKLLGKIKEYPEAERFFRT
jgi:hypothetical protein